MNKNIKNMVARADAAKKVNPRDLSSDQDLTIGLMNLIAIEDIAPDSQIATMVADVRKELMERVVKQSDYMGVSYTLLGQAMTFMEDGMRAFPDKNRVYECFDAAYEAYAMFWGLNMGFIKLKDIGK